MPDTVQHTATADGHSPAVDNDHQPKPVTGRIIGIDVARGIALLAMIIAHLYPFKGFAGAFLEGFPSALFAVLSGISMTIIFSKRGAVDVFIRGIILVVIGIMVTPYAGTIIVVLKALGIGYIVFALLQIPRWSTKWVATGFAVLLAVSGIVHVITLHTTLHALLREPYPIVTWLAYMAAGVLFAHWLRNNNWQITPSSASGFLVAAAGVVISVVGVLARDWIDSAYAVATRNNLGIAVHGFFDAKPHSGGLVDALATIAGSLTVILLCLLLVQTDRWVFPLKAMGSMALTVYLGHVISAGIINRGHIATQYPELAIGTIVVAVVGTSIWAMFFRYGPLEYVLGLVARTGAQAVAGITGKRSDNNGSNHADKTSEMSTATTNH